MSSLDLHIHSSYSTDGDFAPKILVDKCLEANLKLFSIADHNCVRAIHEAKMYCEDKDIEIVPAVELDCVFKTVNLHLLGYGIDYHSSIFAEIEENILSQEQTASKKRVKLVRDLGIDFQDEVIADLSKNGIVTGEMIAEAAMQFDKEHKNPLLQPYYEEGPRSDNPYVNFYWDYCAQGRPAHVGVKYMTLQEAINVIEENGGIPVLAHPGNNIKEDDALLEDIIGCGITGIEVYSSYHSEEQKLFYKDYALRHELVLTCGSDFHGKTKPGISIGSSNCENNEEDIILALRKALKLY